ncbi:MAG: hypothetical protein BMS9Abin06_0001 [Gammaproteobacteria bacterium]|nr:MAG: hypothetical protein BMS9Abin06_0001 [Gammaproteobacteria bacterium]
MLIIYGDLHQHNSRLYLPYCTMVTPVQMKKLVLLILLLSPSAHADKGASFVQTPYSEQKVLFDFYFDDPQKINSALYWIRSLMNPLMETPYDMAPEFLDLKVIIHGTEIVTVARKNYKKYKDAVERMRYYAELGVEFRVCGLAAEDYGYRKEDFYDFIKVIPSAITELAHWQLQGYAVIRPIVVEKRLSIEEIR